MENLIERGYTEKASEYAMAVILECIFKQEFDIEEMTVQDAVDLLTLPPRPKGWDNHAWGPAVVG